MIRVKKIRRSIMQRVSKPVAALVLGLAVTALATPSFAQSSEGMNGARTQALRQCNTEAGKFKQYTWGNTEITTYRACMTKHGQQE
jgi:glycerol uptake facilitator-like aquaporin